MADSDDDYDRRRVSRDKFRRERNDYQDRNAGNRREDWQDTSREGGWGNQNRDRAPQRRDYRDNYGGQRRDRYSPGDRSDMSPPMKRQRNARDWEGERGYPNYDMGYGGQMGWNDGAGHQRGDNQHRDSSEHYTQPPMRSFKQFLSTLDDRIDDQEAVKKYNDYKLEFRKQQITEFFKKHHEEEWFRSKYHPEEFGKRKTEQEAALKKRLNVFMELFNSGWIDSVSIDVEKAKDIIKLLDAAVIKLEGGTDFDLKALDEDFEEKSKEPDLSLFSVDVEQPKEKEVEWPQEKKPENGEEVSDANKDREESKFEDEDEEMKTGNDLPKVKVETSDDNSKPASETVDSLMEEGEAAEEPGDEQAVDQSQETKPNLLTKENTTNVKKESSEDTPRALHKTVSIFLRNLAPSITKEEVEALCSQYEGFIRVCLADPQPERRFYRRGWATYERHVNIREICWAINSVTLHDCELGAIVNRDLSRRIRSVNGIASDKNIVRADIRHAAKIAFNLDKQRKLWDGDSEEEQSFPVPGDKKPLFGFASKNPLLKNITDYLIEEASAEEEELLGTSEIGEVDDKEANGGPSLDRDESMIKVLDRLILYLRIVHSVDYYNHSDYPNEDEMPNRIGIMHARGMVSTSKVTPQEVDEYIKQFETKIQPFLLTSPSVTEEEAIKLGWKDPNEEVENFIKANTKEQSKDRWLCPLSGKKFRGPDFVRKHILNKHVEKVDEARQNTEYLNNYIYDPKRPQLPEHPSNRPPTTTPNRNDGHHGMGGPPPYGMAPMPGPYPPPPPGSWNYGPRPPMSGFGGPMGGYPGRYPPMGYGGHPSDYGRGASGHSKPRFNRKFNYRDLDAPPEDQDLE